MQAQSAAAQRRTLARWVAKEIIPHEPRVRAWLRARTSIDEQDDIIQEAYCRIAALPSFQHIERPDAYFFSVVRNLFLRRLKRRSIVSIETVAEIESFQDEAIISPERAVDGAITYRRVIEILDTLPERCRRVVELRKIEGWSQKEIADHLGMSEKAVEKQVWLGICALKRAWADQQAEPSLRSGLALRWGRR